MDPQEFISRHEHTEYAKRMEDEHIRQNHRISELEEDVKKTLDLTVSVEKMAVSMQQMLSEIQKQGQRLEVLESRDGERWRSVVGYVITAIIGIVLGFIFKSLGLE